jgi:mannose/fructose/N-acetylgalactosamine-specific phosphotransferase system component IID
VSRASDKLWHKYNYRGGNLMKKITKKILTLGVGLFIIGGLFAGSINITVQASEIPRASVSAIDPPIH